MCEMKSCDTFTLELGNKQVCNAHFDASEV